MFESCKYVLYLKLLIEGGIPNVTYQNIALISRVKQSFIPHVKKINTYKIYKYKNIKYINL